MTTATTRLVAALASVCTTVLLFNTVVSLGDTDTRLATAPTAQPLALAQATPAR